jgi:cholest-4-en-3-one 26-monooxygenase
MSTCPFSNIVDPDIYQGEVPRELFAAMQKQAPIVWQDDPVYGIGYWAVTSQHHLDYVSKNAAIFSSEEKSCFYPEHNDDILAMMRTQLICMDPPDHVKFRRVIRNAFTPKMVESYTDHFRAIVKDVVDKVIDRGECEFVTEIACQLPLIAICELVGVPLEDREDFFNWTNTMIGGDDLELNISEEEAQMAAANVYLYADKLMAMHRENPSNDLVGALLDGVVAGESLTYDEFRGFILLLMVAGNETTRTMTSQGMRILMQHPDQWQMLVETPALIPDAIEEMLRYNPAIIQFRRTVMQDIEFGGVKMKVGDKVILNYQAASQDQANFSNPEKFDITRPQREDVKNKHRAFGIGEHFCLGSHLARLELKVTFEEIISRMKNPRLNGEVNYLRSFLVHGIKEMHIEFEKV